MSMVLGIVVDDMRHAGVAQLVEQLICNQQVGGSSPSTSSSATEYGGIPEWPKGTDCKSAGNAFGGSNPPSPTKKTDKFRLVGFSTKCAFRRVKFAPQVKLSCGQ